MGLAQNKLAHLLVDAVSAVSGRLVIDRGGFFCYGNDGLTGVGIAFIESGLVVGSPAQRHFLFLLRGRVPYASGWFEILELFAGANLFVGQQPDQTEDQDDRDAVAGKDR